MARVTEGVLPPSDPIFKEGLVRSHPLLRKKGFWRCSRSGINFLVRRPVVIAGLLKR